MIELCKQASVEQDREKLFHLVRRINDLDALREDAKVSNNARNRPLESLIGWANEELRVWSCSC